MKRGSLDLVKNLLKTTFPVPCLRTSGVLLSSGPSRLPGHPATSGRPVFLYSMIFTDVRDFPDVRYFHHRIIFTDFRTLRSSVLRMSGPARTFVSCTLGCGSHFHSGWSSDDCRTSGPICASGRPTFSGRPAHPVPQTVTFTHHLYIYTSPFHGIRLNIHFEPIKNTPHSLSHSSTPNPRFPSVLGAFERSSPIK